MGEQCNEYRVSLFNKMHEIKKIELKAWPLQLILNNNAVKKRCIFNYKYKNRCVFIVLNRSV